MSKNLLAFFSLLPSLVLGVTAPSSYERECAALAGSHAPAAQRLRKLFELDWKYEMHESPETATYNGYPGQNDRWTDQSAAAIERRQRELDAPLKVLQSIPRARLSAPDRLNYDLFLYQVRDGIEGRRFKGEYLQLTQLSGPQIDVPEIFSIAPATTVKDYEDQLARLEALPVLIDQQIALLQEGLKAGITPARITLRDVPDQVKSQMAPEIDQNALVKAFRRFPADFPTEKADELRRRAEKALRQQVIPAYQRLYDFLTKTYLPGARESIALGALPDGAAWYAYLAKHSTTTTLTPREIHERGLAEVKRIRGEMDKVIQSARFKGSFSQFTDFLRTDPQFFYTSKEELVRAYRDIAKRIDPGLIRLFGKLPRLPYGVLPVPSYSEKSQTTAYYDPGSAAAGRPGYFFCNTYDLKMRPKWEMEALTLHEAVPGHHLQIALAQEMENVPEFRKFSGYTAFVEGWGLYAESLGGELGMFQTPYSRFGQLTYEMWRAVRLVVDTGIHALGWSRDRAIAYFRENTPKTDHDITVEVDRYIVWPGQALAYKIGQMRMTALREEARKALGVGFDLRAFHDALLRNGAIPLDVLEKEIHSWTAGAKSGSARG